ncbi:hypothetical protein FACS1894163_12040 [Spirochaetia bacterium]|nr:hypothetical protein FACS1894163_12040 [Spirochaetia bacterium]
MNITFLTNIPAPYRIDFYNELESMIRSKNKNLSFSVYFMSLTETGRYWHINHDMFKFNYYIDNGFYKEIKKTYHFHFNPNLIFRIIKSRDTIILGGSWNDFNVVLLCLLKRIKLLKNKLHIWSEANYMSIGASHDNFFKKIFRRFIFNTIDGCFLIPGKIAEMTFDLWNVRNKKFIFLPNLINSPYYIISEEEEKRRYNFNLPKMLIVASLCESIKGIYNFIKSIGIVNLKKIELRIAGEGPDKDIIQKYIYENNLESNIILLGHLIQEEILKEYKETNVFILPSFTDQNPLSIIEAIHMKLPILISERCGNRYETLSEGDNGFKFDPYKPDSISDAFNKLLLSKKRWQQMGEKSLELANTNFNLQNKLLLFLEQIENYS